MSRSLLLLITHLLVLAAGYGWHRAATAPNETPPPAPAVRPEPPAPKPVERKPGSVTTLAGEAPWTGSQCRKAWYALRGSNLAPAEIAELRHRILREWAMKDLRSALIAWSDVATLNDCDISNAIQRSFDGHEEELLAWIKAGDFGLDGSAVLLALTFRINHSNPALTLKLVPGVPAEFQERVLQDFFASNRSPGLGKAVMDERLAGIAGLPDERLQALAWQAAFKGLASSGDDQFHENLARTDLPPGVHAAALESFATSLALRNTSIQAIADFHKLSPEDQAAIGPALLAQAETLSFARPAAVTNALTMLAESEQWELLAAKGPAAIDQLCESGKSNPEVLGRWAMQLPQREETAGTFRNALAARFRSDLPGSAAWVHSLPAGWQREQALAQLALTAERTHRDPATRDAALGAVTDPAILADLKATLRQK